MGNKPSAYVVSDGSSGNSDAAAALPGGSFQSMELSITCNKLKSHNVISKMDPFVVVWLMRGTQWVEVTRTQIVDNNSSPVFDAVLARFNIEEIQQLKFVVYDSENSSGVDLRGKRIIGLAQATVHDILHAGSWSADLISQGSRQGTITVTGERMIESSIDIHMHMRCEEVEQFEVFSTVDPFIRVSRFSGIGGPLIKCFSTEKQKGKNVKFEEVIVPFQHLANSDMNRSIKFEVFDFDDSGNHTLLADTDLTLFQLAQRVAEGRGALGIPMKNCRKPGKPCKTTLHFDYFQANRVPSLWDYLKGGTDLSFITAIDFTGTNGESESFFAHHTYDQEKKKEKCSEVYSGALYEIGNVLETYDSDGQFPIYGFKGDLMFALNGEDQPYVHGINGITGAFNDALHSISLNGETHLEPVIMKAAQYARTRPPEGSANQKYIVMLILTDGNIKDNDRVIEAMASCASLAITFIIVVVGPDPDGDNMKEFETLKRKCRAHTTRDMMQIIQMHSLAELSQVARSFTIARQLIKELPTQLVTFYTALNIMPLQRGDEHVQYGRINLLTQH